jgi:tetratricopeptide (TPR) repeat protein
MRLRWIALISLFGLLFTACGPDYSEKSYPLELLDTLNLIHPDTRASLETAPYPEGFAFVIETQPATGPAAWVGAQAEEAFAAAAARHPNPKAFAARGVLLLLTTEPSLVQVRTGAELRSLAQWQGLSAGPTYLHWQELALAGNPDSALLGLTEHLISGLPEATNLSGVRKLVYEDAMNFLGAELGNLSLPSESFYSQSMLKPMVRLFATFQRWGLGWWLGYVLVFFGAWLVGSILNRWLLRRLLRRKSQMVQNFAARLLQFLLSILVGVPSIGGVLLLSSSRIEDQLGLEAMGISTSGPAPLNLEAWSAAPWWLALLVAVLFLLVRLVQGSSLLLQAAMPELEQRQQYFLMQKQDFLGVVAMEFFLVGREDEEAAAEKRKAPFSYLASKHLQYSLMFTPLMGLFCGLFLPRAMAIALLWFLVVSCLRSLIAEIHGKMKENQATTRQQDYDEDLVNDLLQQIGQEEQAGNTEGVFERLQQIGSLTGQLKPLNFYLDRYLAEENYAFAAQLMELRLEKEPWNRTWIKDLAELYRKSGEVESEMEQLALLYELHQQVAADPEISSALVRWAGLLMTQGKYADSVQRYREGLALKEDPQVRAQLALALLGAEEIAQAKAEVAAILAADEGVALAWMVQGEILAEHEHDLPAACEAFLRARELGMIRPEIEAFLAEHHPPAGSSPQLQEDR